MSKKFIKYFHELTKREFEGIRKKNPRMTYGECAKLYPQPPWCNYPDATFGVMGCWSLLGFMVTGKDYCRDCECFIKAGPKQPEVKTRGKGGR
jgi:hypothetical protein